MNCKVNSGEAECVNFCLPTCRTASPPSGSRSEKQDRNRTDHSAKSNQVTTASNTQMDTMTTAVISFSDMSSNRRIAPDIRPPKRRKTISAALEMKRQLGLQLTSSTGRVKYQQEGNWGRQYLCSVPQFASTAREKLARNTE
jgi:hypothetical protein